MSDRTTQLALGTASAVLVGSLAATVTYGIFGVGGANAQPASEAPDGVPSAEASETVEKRDTFTYELATRNFPTNARGQTYGSDSAADSAKSAPDLIAVIGDNNVAGFVLREDLYGATPTTPEEALKSADSAPKVLTVYDREGRRAIDTFTLSPSYVGTPPAEVK